MKEAKTILKSLLLLISSIAVGFLLLFLVYSIPTERIVDHCKESEGLYEREENKIYNWTGWLKVTRIDNMSDVVMINESICRYHDKLIDNVLLSPMYTVKQTDSTTNISSFLKEDNISGCTNYARYWHGYLVYFIPGLFLYNVGNLKMIMMALEFMIMLLILFKVYQKKPIYTVAYLITFIFLNPVTMALNFQNANVFIISSLLTIIILFFNDYLKERDRYMLFFCFSGILTSYIDLLTYPLLTWAMPITTMLIMNEDDRFDLLFMIKTAFFWGFGYVGMWAGKWILASLFTNENIIMDAYESIVNRSVGSTTNETDLSIMAIFMTIKETLNNPPVVSFLLMGLIMIIAFFLYNKRKMCINRDFVKDCFLLFVVFLSAFAWAFVVRQHFITHQFLECRTLGCAILPAYIILSKIAIEKEAL